MFASHVTVETTAMVVENRLAGFMMRASPGSATSDTRAPNGSNTLNRWSLLSTVPTVLFGPPTSL